MREIDYYGSGSESEALSWLTEGESWSGSDSESAALEWLFEPDVPSRRTDPTTEVARATLEAVPALLEAIPTLLSRLGEASATFESSAFESSPVQSWSDEAEPGFDELWEYIEARPEDQGEPEAAFIAVAGLLVSAAGLGLAVFDRIQGALFKGSFSVTAPVATYIHNPSPAGLVVQTKRFTFPITAHHPRYGFGTQTFWFTLTLEYDGFNIRRATIDPDKARSSELVSSDFTINFQPSAYTASNIPVSAVAYTISGEWNPIGRGIDAFRGRFEIDAAGTLRGMQLSSDESWVRVGAITQSGGGPVPRPTHAVHTTDVHFDRPGSYTLTQENIRHLHGWYQGLPPAVQAEIRAGNQPIQLVARASTTGTIQDNQKLARQRADAVAKVMTDLAGSTAKIVISAHGELGARTADKVEDPAERRVELTTEYEVYRTG